MKIGLIDVDGHNFPNLPIMKLSAWHKSRGDTVEWWMALNKYDIVYKSKVFDFAPDINTVIQADQIIEGGTGYNLKGKLPEEVEHIMPDYSLYPMYKEAYGFLTRGCPRNCGFCIVSEKEGLCSKQVADLSEFWTGQKTIKLLDPNLLACTEHEKLLKQLINSRAKIDFTQGLDARLLNPDNAKLISEIKINMLHFAWDSVEDNITPYMLWHFKKLSGLNERKLGVYVLTNYNSTLEEDLYRIYRLRELGYDPYVMVYNKTEAPKQIRHLQRWVNNKWVWRTCERFEDFNTKLA
ncbi:hypothetical protein DFR58_101117 [Anaerobacterium chartisolvens]|uniref:Radical SAM protein n=1 Tax=Anaerobacterium chartisolvens TaxID=1297424 RepID=A0A369BI28_9FIRM|nr:radical SAM protein [Anaerobacterium chartisolvens]RCX20915.1 hypothetical protein DFR58_101117 [Anaerobacterium chartisolvens]